MYRRWTVDYHGLTGEWPDEPETKDTTMIACDFCGQLVSSVDDLGECADCARDGELDALGYCPPEQPALRPL